MRLSYLLAQPRYIPAVLHRATARSISNPVCSLSWFASGRSAQRCIYFGSSIHRGSRPSRQSLQMASGFPLPQSVADDLQLLHQHYQQLQLPFTLDGAHDTSEAFPDLVQNQAAAASPAVLPSPTEAAGQQLMMSAAADSSKHKRRKLSSNHQASVRSTELTNSSNSPSAVPAAAVALGPSQPGLVSTDTAGYVDAATPAAALQAITPPPKPPRSRHSKKASTLPAVSDPPATQQTTTAIRNTTTTTVVAAAAVAPEALAPAAAAPKKRSRRKSSPAPEQQLAADATGATTEAAAIQQLEEAAAGAEASAPPTTPAKKTRACKRKAAVVREVVLLEGPDTQPAAAAAAAAAAPGATAAAAEEAAAAAEEAAAAAAPKSARGKRRTSSTGTRSRAKRSTASATATADSTEDASVEAAEAEVPVKPPKPVRRTKKVIAAEVLEAASQGQFGELTNLSSTYSHVAMFNSSSNAAAWQQLMQQAKLQTTAAPPAAPPMDTPNAGTTPAAAAAAGSNGRDEEQQQQLASNNRSSSLSLCRTSGLGSFRQQVWIHSQSQSVFDAEETSTQDPLAGQLTPSASLPAAAAGGAGGDATGSQDAAAAAEASGLQVVQLPVAPQPLTPELQQRQLKVLPNLGYACLCMTMRKYDIFNSRDCVKKTRGAADGLNKVSELALQNARDLVPLIHWNEAHGIRLFRLSSNIFPWMTSYKFEDLPHWPDIQKALRAAGVLAKQLGHRLTFHPSEYCKIAGERPAWVDQSVAELEVHSRIFDEMGFLPATPYNKINIHVGGTYGDRDAALERFSQVVNERLSPNCKARLTVENDDRASLYSVVDLMKVHQATGIPIVFDFHHWKFCTGDQTQEEAFRTALTTWPQGVRPLVHWSESPEDPNKMLKAHSEYIDGPINLYGLEEDVDVMIESKGKELALLEYRQYIIDGGAVGPRTARVAKLAADAAAAAAAAQEDDGSEEEKDGDTASVDND